MKGLPSCQVTPWRSGKISSVPSSFHDQPVARSGTIDARRASSSSPTSNCWRCWCHTYSGPLTLRFALPKLGDEAAALELTYNWDPEPYTGGRNFGHLAYAVDNIYDTCSAFIARGVTINRPPRDGRMAFIRTPDGISIELLQAGEALAPAEPWTSMANTGSW